MSSRSRKLAKRIKLTQLQAKASKTHGCEECRGVEFRQKIIRQLVEKGLITSPPTLICPACSAGWHVKFGSDAAGNAIVSFTVALTS